jgi:hypothetical protein
MEREINIVMALPRQSSVRGCRRVHDEYPPYSISYLCHSPGYFSCRRVFDDLAQCRRSQRQHGSAAGHDRLGSTPSAVATAYRPELIDSAALQVSPNLNETGPGLLPDDVLKIEMHQRWALWENSSWPTQQSRYVLAPSAAQKSKSVVTQTKVPTFKFRVPV